MAARMRAANARAPPAAPNGRALWPRLASWDAGGGWWGLGVVGMGIPGPPARAVGLVQ